MLKVLFVSYTNFIIFRKKLQCFVLFCHIGEGPFPIALVEAVISKLRLNHPCQQSLEYNKVNNINLRVYNAI